MKKIFIIGDSLTLPGHGNNYEDTWVYLIKQHYRDVDFITFCKRQLTTEVLVSMGGEGDDKYPKGSDCLEFFNPSIVILQLGIVDCSPRLLYNFERKILNYMPGILTKQYIGVVKKLRKRNDKNTIVPINKFEKYVNNYFSRCKKKGVKVIVLGICTPSDEMLKKNPTINTNVIAYNNIYKKLTDKYNFIIIDPLNPERHKDEIYSDGYHPNKTGHRIIYQEVSAALNEF